MTKKPYIVGICGGTCSGKSTLSENLKSIFSDKYKVIVIHMDTYYRKPMVKTIAPITLVEYTEANHPDSMTTERLFADFAAAIADKDNDILIVEGLFSFHFAQIREKLDLKIYVDLRSDERMYRRIKRWMDRTPIDAIVSRFLDTVRFRHDEFVEPRRWHADIVINGTLDTNLGTDVLVTYIKDKMNQINEINERNAGAV